MTVSEAKEIALEINDIVIRFNKLINTAKEKGITINWLPKKANIVITKAEYHVNLLGEGYADIS